MPDTDLVVIDGNLIEKPVLRDMHRIVAIADRIGGMVVIGASTLIDVRKFDAPLLLRKCHGCRN
jgi:hypothetical protein